jgi:predicted ATPase/class 3 adenylate cyclase
MVADPPDFTFLFTDIEGSTRLWGEAPDEMAGVLARHDRILVEAISSAGGRVFKHTGDGFIAVFDAPGGALAAAVAIQQHELLLAEQPVPVRTAIHRGPAIQRDGDYFGLTLSRAARLLAAGHGGQVILSGDVAEAVGSDLPPGLTLRDLGLFRLRDLTSRERIFQVDAPGLRGEFPPLRTLEAYPHNLPAQVSSFVGREQEIGIVRDLMRRHRCVTLTGAGGSGKTRLALQAAAEALDDFEHGVRLVELATVEQAGLAPRAVATALGLKDESRPVAESLREHLRDRQMLLVLDNCEHLVGAAAELAADLLAECPGVRVLATSREPLSLRGEATFRVPSLSLPSMQRGDKVPRLEDLRAWEAPRLFEERARLAADFILGEENAADVLRICRRLDGMPLALELAAARVKVLSPAQIADRLDDRFRLLRGGSRDTLPRQQTLRALVDWSHDLLSSEERTLIRRLSVFAGGWDLEAAEEVAAGGEIRAEDLLDLLERLVEKSLVVADTQAGAARYRMLETIREYSRERLTEVGEETEFRRRHFAWALGLADRSEAGLSGPEQARFLERLEEEHDNCRAALGWAEAHGSPADMQRLGAALWRFWFVHGYLHEGRDWLRRALAGGPTPPEVRAAALNGAGNLAWVLRDLDAARAYHEEALALRREVGNPLEIGGSLNNLGLIARHTGDLLGARHYFQEALEVYQAAHHRARLAITLNNLGGIATEMKDVDLARRLYEEALPHQENPASRADTLASLGGLLTKHGQAADGLQFIREALRIRWKLGDLRTVARSLASIAAALAGLEDEELAVLLIGAAASLERRLEAPSRTGEDEFLAEIIHRLQVCLGPDLYGTLFRDGGALEPEDAVRLALGE